MATSQGTEILYKKESRLGMTTLTYRSKRYTFPSVIVKSDLKSEGVCVLLDVGLFCPYCTGTFTAKMMSSRSRLAITKSSSYEEAMKHIENLGRQESFDSQTTSGSSDNQAGDENGCHSDTNETDQTKRRPSCPCDTDTFEEKVEYFEKTLHEMQTKGSSSCEVLSRKSSLKKGKTESKERPGGHPQDKALLVEQKEARMTFRHDRISKMGEKRHVETFSIPCDMSDKGSDKCLIYQNPSLPAPELLLRGKLLEQEILKRKDNKNKKDTEDSGEKGDTEIITELRMDSRKDLSNKYTDAAPCNDSVMLELRHITNLERGTCTTSAVKSVPVELSIADEHSLTPSPIVEGSILSDYGSLETHSQDTSLQDINESWERMSPEDVMSRKTDNPNLFVGKKGALHLKQRGFDKILEETEEVKTKHGSLETLRVPGTKQDDLSWSSEDVRKFKLEVHRPISLTRYNEETYLRSAFRPIQPTNPAKFILKDNSTQTTENFDSILRGQITLSNLSTEDMYKFDDSTDQNDPISYDKASQVEWYEEGEAEGNLSGEDDLLSDEDIIRKFLERYGDEEMYRQANETAKSTESGESSSSASESYRYERLYDSKEALSNLPTAPLIAGAEFKRYEEELQRLIQSDSVDESSDELPSDHNGRLSDSPESSDSLQKQDTDSGSESDEDSGAVHSPFNPEAELEEVLENIESSSISPNATLSRFFTVPRKTTEMKEQSEIKETSKSDPNICKTQRDLSPETILDLVLEAAKDLTESFTDWTSDYGSEHRGESSKEEDELDELKELNSMALPHEEMEHSRSTSCECVAGDTNESVSSARPSIYDGSDSQSLEYIMEEEHKHSIQERSETDNVTFYLSDHTDDGSVEQIIDHTLMMTEELKEKYAEDLEKPPSPSSEEEPEEPSISMELLNAMESGEYTVDRPLELETIDESPEETEEWDTVIKERLAPGAMPGIADGESTGNDGTIQQQMSSRKDIMTSTEIMNTELTVITDSKYFEKCLFGSDEVYAPSSPMSKDNRPESEKYDEGSNKVSRTPDGDTSELCNHQHVSCTPLHEIYDAIHTVILNQDMFVNEPFFQESAVLERSYSLEQLTQSGTFAISGHNVSAQRTESPEMNGIQVTGELPNAETNVTQSSQECGLPPDGMNYQYGQQAGKECSHIVSDASTRVASFSTEDKLSREQAEEFMRYMLASHDHSHEDVDKQEYKDDLSACLSQICQACADKEKEGDEEVVSEEVTTKEVMLVFAWPRKKGEKPITNPAEPFKELHLRRVTRIKDFDIEVIEGPTVSGITRGSPEEATAGLKNFQNLCVTGGAVKPAEAESDDLIDTSSKSVKEVIAMFEPNKTNEVMKDACKEHFKTPKSDVTITVTSNVTKKVIPHIRRALVPKSTDESNSQKLTRESTCARTHDDDFNLDELLPANVDPSEEVNLSGEIATTDNTQDEQNTASAGTPLPLGSAEDSMHNVTSQEGMQEAKGKVHDKGNYGNDSIRSIDTLVKTEKHVERAKAEHAIDLLTQLLEDVAAQHGDDTELMSHLDKMHAPPPMLAEKDASLPSAVHCSDDGSWTAPGSSLMCDTSAVEDDSLLHLVKDQLVSMESNVHGQPQHASVGGGMTCMRSLDDIEEEKESVDSCFESEENAEGNVIEESASPEESIDKFKNMNEQARKLHDYVDAFAEAIYNDATSTILEQQGESKSSIGSDQNSWLYHTDDNGSCNSCTRENKMTDSRADYMPRNQNEYKWPQRDSTEMYSLFDPLITANGTAARQKPNITAKLSTLNSWANLEKVKVLDTWSRAGAPSPPSHMPHLNDTSNYFPEIQPRTSEMNPYQFTTGNPLTRRELVAAQDTKSVADSETISIEEDSETAYQKFRNMMRSFDELIGEVENLKQEFLAAQVHRASSNSVLEGLSRYRREELGLGRLQRAQTWSSSLDCVREPVERKAKSVPDTSMPPVQGQEILCRPASMDNYKSFVYFMNNLERQHALPEPKVDDMPPIHRGRAKRTFVPVHGGSEPLLTQPYYHARFSTENAPLSIDRFARIPARRSHSEDDMRRMSRRKINRNLFQMKSMYH